MQHAPKFWADKLQPEQRPLFWFFIQNWPNFSGETLFCMIENGSITKPVYPA